MKAGQEILVSVGFAPASWIQFERFERQHWIVCHEAEGGTTQTSVPLASSAKVVLRSQPKRPCPTRLGRAAGRASTPTKVEGEGSHPNEYPYKYTGGTGK